MQIPFDDELDGVPDRSPVAPPWWARWLPWLALSVGIGQLVWLVWVVFAR